jgi:hypothetical protein
LLRRALITVCLAFACVALPAAAASGDIVVDYGSAGWSYKAVPTDAGSLTPDASWATGGTMPFGSLSSCASGLPAPTSTGNWVNNSDLLLSKTFTLPPGTGPGSVAVRVDNDVAVTVNGQSFPTAQHEGCANVDPPGAIPVLAATLHAGPNVIALRAHDRTDQRYIDAQVQVDIPDGFTVGVAPGTITAGTAATFQATITNWGTATLDTVTLTPPDGLGGPVVLSGLGLAQGATVTKSFSRTAACGPHGGDWGASATGLPLLGGAGSTSVTGDCSVAFGTAPAAARTSQVISGTAYTPGGPAVTVRVLDGGGQAVADGTPVTMSIAANPSGAGSLQGTRTRTTTGGTATFDNLSIDKPGGYRLTADVPGVGSVTTPEPITIDDVVTVCTGTSCTATGSTPSTDVQAVGTSPAGSGPSFVSLSLNAGPTLNCDGYNEFSPDWVTVNGSANLTQKLITYKISYRTLFAGWQLNGLSRIQACYSAPYSFATRAGYPALKATPFEGATWYTGILPECKVLSTTKPPPCVQERKLLRDGIAVTVKAPGGAMDPRMRG